MVHCFACFAGRANLSKMMISKSILALGLLGVASAFGPIGTVGSSKNPSGQPGGLSSEPATPEPQAPAAPEPLFPLVMPMETMQGGKSIRTFKMPPGTLRAQYMLRTNGRPLKAKVEVLIGPIRTTHTCNVDSMNGKESPVRGTIQFKKNTDPMLRITTTGQDTFPVEVGMTVPTPARSEEIAAITTETFDTAPVKMLSQGGTAPNDNVGAVRSFEVPADVDAVQLVTWSRDVGKKSLKARIEVLKGPNSQRQTIYLQCGGSTQPWHGIIETPGSGWIIRVRNLKYIEDGHFEIAMAPYDLSKGASTPQLAPATQMW